MLCLGMVSTHLYILFSSMRGSYKVQIAEGWNWQRIFLNKRVRLARADKAVALQYHYQ